MKRTATIISITAISVAVMLVSILPVFAQQGGPSATRSFDNNRVAPGGQVTVTIAAANYGSFGAVTETLPNGFSYVSSSLEADEVSLPSRQTVRFILQGADKTFTYTVTASSAAGEHSFSGKLRDSDRGDHDVGGESRVTVEGAQGTSQPSATRSFDNNRVTPGGQVTVTIAAADYGSFGAVTETVPNGFSYVSSSLEADEVSLPSRQTVRFILQGADKTFTYTVTASSAAGEHSFSGKLRDSDRGDHDVGGESRVTVEGAQGTSQPSATRSFDNNRVAPGGQVTVTIAAADYGSFGAVTETLPSGFSYVSSSLGADEVSFPSRQTVRFILQGADKTFTYTVTASSVAGEHSFSGKLRDSDRGDHDVGGESRVTVEGAQGTSQPSAARSFDNNRVAPGGQVTVTIAAAGYGSFGAVTEMLPNGFSYVSSSLGADEVSLPSRQTVRFILQGADKTFTFTVTASSVAGEHSFSGKLRDSDRGDHDVGGESRVTVTGLTLGCATGGAVADAANNPGLVSDCDTLLAARDTLVGTATLNWSASTAIARWDGVTLGGTPERVSKVKLQKRELTGRIPAEIGRLDALEELWLYNNELTGTIPPELGALNSLRWLFVSTNKLSGQIPETLNNLSLDRLWLHKNSFTGCVPYNLTLTREYKVDRGLSACASPTPTPTRTTQAPESPPPTWIFAGGISEEHQTILRDEMEAVRT